MTRFPFLSAARRWRAAAGASFALLAWLSGCVVAQVGASRALNAPAAAVACAPAELAYPLPGPVLTSTQLAADILLRRHFTAPTLAAANRYGLGPDLHQLVAAPPGSLARLNAQQRVGEQLAALALLVGSTTAELDCEEERADQVADYLLDQAARRIRRYTLLAIVLGALGTVVTGGLALLEVRKSIYRPVGIVFGLAGAALGLLSLYAPDTRIPYAHRRNALADIGLVDVGPVATQPRTLAAPVWAYLTAPAGAAGALSRREALLHRWQTTGELGAKSSADRQRLLHLLFGRGGTYAASELQMRANFYDQLESSVALMKQELAQLAAQVAALPQPYSVSK